MIDIDKSLIELKDKITTYIELHKDTQYPIEIKVSIRELGTFGTGWCKCATQFIIELISEQ